jgi:hypothetical protein
MIAAAMQAAVLLKAQIHWPPFDFPQGGEDLAPQPERLSSEFHSMDNAR